MVSVYSVYRRKSMSTTALNGMYPVETCPRGVMPTRQNDVRRIVREEIERQKKLDELERKYQNGEISKFEYYTNKVALNLPQPTIPPVYCPTVEYMA